MSEITDLYKSPQAVQFRNYTVCFSPALVSPMQDRT